MTFPRDERGYRIYEPKTEEELDRFTKLHGAAPREEYAHALTGEHDQIGWPTVDWGKLGTISGMSNLVSKCSMCDERADFEVTRVGIPKVLGQFQLHDSSGKTHKATIRYCKPHIPDDVKAAWNGEVSGHERETGMRIGGRLG